MSPSFKEYVRQLHHKRAVRAAAAIAVIAGLPIIGAYGYFFAVKKVRVDRVFFPLSHKHPGLKGLRVAQISDLHYGPTNRDHKYFNKTIDLILNEKPDIIFLTGDYYQWDPECIAELPPLLSRLAAPLGVFGVFGNHDYGACYPGTMYCDPFDHNRLKSLFGDNGIVMLANESLGIAYKDSHFNLVGLHDLWSGFFDPEVAYRHVDTKHPTIVLSHNPDTAHLVKPDYDLMLSGHVHGGQVSLPWIGPIAVPVKNRHLRRGLHQISDRKHIYVNRGLGYTFRMRWNSPPEVTLLEIV